MMLGMNRCSTLMDVLTPGEQGVVLYALTLESNPRSQSMKEKCWTKVDLHIFSKYLPKEP